MVFKLSKKAYFLQFCADRSKKFKPIKEIYIYTSERPRYKMVLFIMLWLTVSEILVFEVGEVCETSDDCWVSIFFDFLNTNISWTVGQTPIKHSIF